VVFKKFWRELAGGLSASTRWVWGGGGLVGFRHRMIVATFHCIGKYPISMAASRTGSAEEMAVVVIKRVFICYMPGCVQQNMLPATLTQPSSCYIPTDEIPH
jgi:hypothetical protein